MICLASAIRAALCPPEVVAARTVQRELHPGQHAVVSTTVPTTMARTNGPGSISR